MDNTEALRKGTAKAKGIIRDHALNTILIPFANGALDYITQRRISEGHNMTGNTVNAYVVGVFEKGKLIYMRGSWESIPKPLTRKVYVYSPGRQRWDGETQEHKFPTQGVVSHNGATEPDRAIAFIQGFQASSKGWTVVVANGIEYASFEENTYGADVLTGSIDYLQMFAPQFIKPTNI